MTCDEIGERGIDEEYLLGRLSEPERDEFEQHYFECPHCYARLESLRAVRDALAESRGAAGTPFEPVESAGWKWQWLAAAAAIALIAGAAWLWRTTGAGSPEAPVATAVREVPRSTTPPPEPVPGGRRLPEEITRLARVEAPPYAPARLRGAAPREEFGRAMSRYQRREYAAAIPLLESVVRQDAAADDARFYLGASYLLAARARDGIETLRPLASKPASPFVEEARFLTAKGWIQAGDLPQALSALDRTIALRGEREREARAMRQRLASYSPEP